MLLYEHIRYIHLKVADIRYLPSFVCVTEYHVVYNEIGFSVENTFFNSVLSLVNFIHDLIADEQKPVSFRSKKLGRLDLNLSIFKIIHSLLTIHLSD